MLGSLELIAVVSGAACVAGLLLAVVALVGTRRPPGPRRAAGRGCAGCGRGPGSNPAEQRRLPGAAGRRAGRRRAGVPAHRAAGGGPAGGGGGARHPVAVRRRAGPSSGRSPGSRRSASGPAGSRTSPAPGRASSRRSSARSRTAPEQIEEEVRLLAARLQAGWLARSALLAFADEIADPVCDQVVAALILHLTDRGERLGDVLGSIAGAASAEVATRREIEAKRTQPRFAVRFLTGMTLATLAYGLVNTEYIRPYGTPVGQLVMVVLGAAFIGLLAWVRSMSQPPRPARFLPAPDPDEVIA